MNKEPNAIPDGSQHRDERWKKQGVQIAMDERRRAPRVGGWCGSPFKDKYFLLVMYIDEAMRRDIAAPLSLGARRFGIRFGKWCSEVHAWRSFV